MEKHGTLLPRSQTGQVVQLTPASAALARTYDTSISSATDITLNEDTGVIEVTAIDQGVFLRYQTTASSANFDEYIHGDTTRHFVIPTGCTVISVIERAATGAVVVIEKSSIE